MEQKERSVVLNEDELALCNKIAGEQKNPFQKRAMALLALNEGKSRREVAELSGLAPGQVKYISAKFLKIRTEILHTAGKMSEQEAAKSKEFVEQAEEKTQDEAAFDEEAHDADEIEVEIIEETAENIKKKKTKKDKKKDKKKKQDKKEKKEKKEKKKDKDKKRKSKKQDKDKKKKSGKKKKSKE